MDGYVVGVVTVVLFGVVSALLCSSSYVFCLVAIFVLYSFIVRSSDQVPIFWSLSETD